MNSAIERVGGAKGSKGPDGDAGSATLCWPVGSVFVSVVATNPATLFGFGTWSAIAAGRLLVGLDSGDSDFNAGEKTGGAKTVAIAGTNGTPVFTGTTNQQMSVATTGSTGTSTTASTRTLKAHRHTVTPTGNVSAPVFTGSPTSVVQPYFVVYIWKRTT